MYSKAKKCGNCERVKALLTKYDVPYSVVNIDEDSKAEQMLTSLGFKALPQIFCGDYLFVEGGFPALMKLSKEEIVGRMNQYKFGSTN